MKLPNVIFIVIDALRANNLGCYGYNKNTSPFIDKISEEALLFKNAFSTTNVTDASLTSIFSGFYPKSHGIINHAEKVTKQEINTFQQSEIQLLPEILKSFGYNTLAIDWLGKWHRKGYDYYSGFEEEGLIKQRNKIFKKCPAAIQTIISNVYRTFILNDSKKATLTTNQALKAFELDRNKPFFMFIHYWDVHTPYTPPKHFLNKLYKNTSEGKNDFSEIINSLGNEKWRNYIKKCFGKSKSSKAIIANYDASIRYVDNEIERIVHFLEQKGIYDDTLIIITSDHGESLTEHGIYFDHHGLYDVNTHVPLIMRYPPLFPEKKQIQDLVQHIDLVPTILEILNINVDEDFDGKSLLPLISHPKTDHRSVIFTEESYVQRKRAIRTKDYKYICALSEEKAMCRYCERIHGGLKELYDLNLDPDETENIIESKQEIADKFDQSINLIVRHLDHKKRNRKKRLLKQKIKSIKNI